ncbi:MAG: hypothetical protein IT373_22750, partial [Polyangiaceae bacterium]|nr:hypothetical protein [Polyangiaceae bacterium]
MGQAEASSTDAPTPGPAGAPRARGLTSGFVVAFALTWLAYASYYLCRKNFGVVKAKLDLDEGWLVAIDTAMLAAYAVGQFASGAI